MKLALVFGGTGAVGSEVLKGLRQRGVSAVFTYHRSSERAQALATEYGHRAVQADLTEPGAVTRVFAEAKEPGGAGPSIVLYCAGVAASSPLAELGPEEWARAVAVNCRAPLLVCQEIAKRPARPGGEDLVFLGALDRAQSLPLPVAFAATQGMLAALVMSAAKELGPRGARVNLVALGPLEKGLSEGLGAKLLTDYKAFSALRRVGRPEEAAKVALWLALENTYVSGETIACNGGI